MPIHIDPAFCFLQDTPPGRDPDTYSPTLRQYHKLLWSRNLPGGQVFTLRDDVRGAYLLHESEAGQFRLSSDSIIPTYKRYKRLPLANIVSEVDPQRVLNFFHLSYTIGGMTVFPANKVNNKPTINMDRGTSRSIGDRFDLTLECIRCHYFGLESPLSSTLERYRDFFSLFRSFDGYVEFFLFQDLVTDSGNIRFFLPHGSFVDSPFPSSVSQYYEYMDNSMKFIEARNQRITALRSD